jgi:predicted transcriptional regulator of viral defense system
LHLPIICVTLSIIMKADKNIKYPGDIPDSLPFYFRPLDVEKKGISRDKILKWLRHDWVERVNYGIYRISSAPLTEYETIAMVCARVQDAVICLLSALQIHDIGTQLPHQVWIAIDQKAMEPALNDFPVRLVRFSGRMLTCGVESFDMQGVKSKITTPARTVVDCIRFRNKVGLDVAMEALKDALRSKQATVDQILQIAKDCRAQSVVRPYLEALVS